MEFTLEVDGKPREPQNQEMQTEIGTGQVFQDIETALVGMKPDDKKDVDVEFSDRHQSADLRGKKGVFRITLKDVKERVFPAIDDEFAKDCGSDTLEALKANLRDKDEKELKQKAIDSVAEQLVIELCKKNPIPVPPSLVEQQATVTERELVATARRQGQRI